MARKSRKNLVIEAPAAKVFRAAAYLRLSVSKANQDSESIKNQRHIIEDYISDKPDIELTKIYVDENVSGTTFKRNGFQNMLAAIERGEISCVIVKDVSRLGRDFLGTAHYIEQYFPSKKVRFIAVSDGFDTIDGITNIDAPSAMASIRIPMTNLFNEKYAEDIRRKTQSSIDSLIHAGKYVAPRAPYGYMKALDDCHQLIVDEAAAHVVREIFSMAMSNVSLNEIVRRLNLADIPTPIEYAKSKGLQGNYDGGDGTWNTRSVKYILTNRTYAGDLQQGQDNYLVENTHEALVSRDVFLAMQERFAASERQAQEKAPPTDNPLKGKVICGSCGSKMQRRKGSSSTGWYFFSCITNNRKGCGCSTGMYIRESEIWQKIQSELSLGVSKTELDMAIETRIDRIIVYKSGKSELLLW
ncbi:recombinase family protein [Christensenellaceae bacterium OttesenSCG-928-M15]|nr:recombinase family protein [Christensenellaceae bacterium OttesenSCG-928-M15]